MRFWYVAYLCFGATTSVAAQIAAPTDRVVSGRVVDSVSGRALPRAVLYFERVNQEYQSGPDGRFRIEGVRPLDTLLVVRRIGYVPVRVPVPFSVSAAEMDVGTVWLRPVATKLDVIAVEAEEVRRYPQLDDFYRRKHLGRAGFFLTPEEIARANARRTSNLLERSSKVKTECNDTGRWQKGAPFDCTAQNSRPQGAGGMRVEQCALEVWVDGVRTAVNVDDVPVREILAIEVYNGPATTPTVFGSGHCGVVAIWTTSGRGR
ncbi:MAG: carboxypeptidase regulatory-like domain-containing protein [Gemmatimonadetes bacterium]|nr:carboxypeptidase regulatory-like domain-containing protein [Gemmatimonadota bacterium]